MLVNRTSCRSTVKDCFATTDMTRLISHNRGGRRKSSVVFAMQRPMNLRWVPYIYATHKGHSGMHHSYEF
jgi:hypothetical protein